MCLMLTEITYWRIGIRTGRKCQNRDPGPRRGESEDGYRGQDTWMCPMEITVTTRYMYTALDTLQRGDPSAPQRDSFISHAKTIVSQRKVTCLWSPVNSVRVRWQVFETSFRERTNH